MENSNRQARPWDLFNKNIAKVTDEIAQKRLSICMACPNFIKLTSQCKKCGCFMKGKARLSNSSCPIGKWGRVSISYKEEEV